jgi:hypothetical protein
VISWIDAGAVVAVGVEFTHEREGGRILALAWVEQDDRDVLRLAVDVLQQRRRSEEGIKRARSADENQRSVYAFGVLRGEGVDEPRHVRGDSVRPLDVWRDLVAKVSEGPLRIALEEPGLAGDESLDVLLAGGAEGYITSGGGGRSRWRRTRALASPRREYVVVRRNPLRLPVHAESAEVPEIVLLIAACYAAGMAVRVGLGAAFLLPHHDTIRVPVDAILNGARGRAEAPIRLGKMYLAGAGAVGNGFLWALSTFDVQGELHIVDPKNVSNGNLGRCLWFEFDDVDHPKAERLAARAQPHLTGLKLIARVATVQTLSERTDGAWLERVIVGVDSRRARRRLQGELPRDVFDASTTGIEEVVVHFNSAVEPGACLSCVYHDDPVEAAHEAHVASVLGVEVNDVQQHYVSEDAAARMVLRHSQLVASGLVGRAYDSLFKAMCGTGQLGVDEGRTVLAPLAFVSVLAGAYLALEVALRAEAREVARPFNYWRASPWTSPVFELRTVRPPRDGCETCGVEVIRATVRSLWGTNGKGPI